MGKFNAVHFNRDPDGATRVSRYYVDARAFTAEKTAEKEYGPGELDADAAADWCEVHGFDAVFDDRDVARDLGIETMQMRYLHRSLPDRVDLAKTSDGRVRVTFFDRRGRRDVPADGAMVDDRSLEDLESFLKGVGYNTFNWQRGARAFRGEPWPVRTRREIWRKRRQLEEIADSKMGQNPERWHAEETLLAMDLAYAG
jgi:hypothetical protein